MRYEKPFKTYEEQADILTSRGMIANRSELICRLQDAGYYHLSGYWHIFLTDSNAFLEGTTLNQAWDLYIFDRQFRLITFDAIERVEVYLRTQLAYELAKTSGPFGFSNPANLPNLPKEDYDKLMGRCRNAHNRSREQFAMHFKEAYGDEHELPPYWVLVNLMDFGMITTLYRGAPAAVRKSVSRAFDIEPRVMDSWLVTLNTVRNICAHHGRLWNRTLGTKPTIPRKKNDARWHVPYEVLPDKMFAVLTILSHMLEIAAPSTAWRDRLFDLLNARSTADMCRMGFTAGWQACPIWARWLPKEGANNKS